MTYINFKGAEIEMDKEDLNGYQSKETHEWITGLPDEEKIRIVDAHKAGGAAILALFGRKGVDPDAEDVWRDLQPTSPTKARAADCWLWMMYEDMYFRIKDFTEV